MALTVSISVEQSALSQNLVTIVDDSTGTDAAVTKRRLYITNSAGTYLVESGTTTDYEAWDNFPSDTEITLDILTEDTSAHILCQWLNSSNVVLYDFEDDYPLSEFGKQFFVYLFQQIASNPGILQDANFVSNLCNFWINVVGGNNMVTIASDLTNAQNCFNRETNMQNNQNYFF